MKKILVTGASGFIGTKLLEKLQVNEDTKIYALYCKKKIKKKNKVQIFNLNLLNEIKLEKIIKLIKPNILFHFAAYINPQLNEKDQSLPKKSYIMTKNIVKNINKHCPNTYLIFLSTDKVFSGKKYLPREFEDNKPSFKYGIFKLKAESLIRRKIKNYSIFRIPIVHGKGENKSCFIDNALTEIKLKKKINIYKNVKRNFILIDTLIKILCELIIYKKIGTFNVGSKYASYYNRIKMLCIKEKIHYKKFLIPSYAENIQPKLQSMNFDKLKFFFGIKIY